MSTVIRPAEPEEMAEFGRIVGLALAMSADAGESMRPEWTLCAFEDDALATCYGAWPFTMRLNGAPVRIAAVTTVSTLPHHRRRGHLRRIMQADFERMHEMEGPALAALYASLAAIYQRFGYAVVSSFHSYRVEPRFLGFSLPMSVRGRLREASRDEGALLNDLFRRYRDPRNGFLHRSRELWARGPLADPPAGHTLSLMVYEEDGEALGYVSYTTGRGAYDGPDVGQALNVRDLAWLTPAAYRAIWEHLGRFDLARELTWRVAPTDDPLPHLILEPRMLRATLHEGLLARVVDVARCLPERPYGGEGRLTFEIGDEMCPWNAGRWQLETSGTETRVSRTTAEPQLMLPVTTLAMLLFGTISATDAQRMGRLDAHDPDALATWDTLMRTSYAPFCPDSF